MTWKRILNDEDFVVYGKPVTVTRVEEFAETETKQVGIKGHPLNDPDPVVREEKKRMLRIYTEEFDEPVEMTEDEVTDLFIARRPR